MQIVELKVKVDKSQLKALAAEVNKLNGKVIKFKTSIGGTGGASPTDGFNTGLKKTQQQAERTGQSIVSVMGKVAKWTAVTTAVYAPIRAFKEAVTTIKVLDTEMVNVQKVTGASAKQMQQFQERAYQLSMEYGRSVTNVAAAMTSFARAGYGDKLDEMAELSTLVQNVGYVSEDTADRMLLAVDAAWKLNGSHSELMKVIDGVDKVTNQNATDFQKMAEGMTVAASVFAESGESIQTFAAMVGTGTAATQRGGSEIARGLRTIMMNIRQIKGETEDGELIDGESIAKASAALQEFAGISTMENGELRKASDVLADLAKKWDELDTVQRSAISEALAGKRQANILTALMGNWDMVEKQMQEYATAAGTALKENEIYMDSWAAKTEQLKAAWTDFVANFVTSDLATGFLDGLIKGVEFLDSGLGQAAISAAALGLAISGIAKAVGAIAGSKAIGLLKDIPVFLASFASVAKGQGLVTALSQVLGMLGPIGIALASIAAIVGTIKLVDAFYIDYDEQGQKINELKDEYESLYGAESEYQDLINKRASDGGLSAWEQRRLDYLQQYQSELQGTIDKEKELAAQKYQEQYGRIDQSTFDDDYYRNGGRGKRTTETVDVKNLREARNAFAALSREFKNGERGEADFKKGLKEILDTYEDFVSATRQGLDEDWIDYSDLTDAQKATLELYESIEKLYSLNGEDLKISAALGEFENAGSGFAEFANNTVVNAEQLKASLEEAGLSAKETKDAINALKNDGVIVIDIKADGVDETLVNLESLGIAVQTADGWEVNVDGLEELASEIGLSKAQVDTLITTLQGVNGVSFKGASTNAKVVYKSVSDLISITKKYTGGSPYNAKITATDNASATIGNISRLLAGLKDKIINVGIKQKIQNAIEQKSGSGSSFTWQRHATGSTNFRGGLTLLGDELSYDGSPRPELVISKGGEAFLAGMSGPVAMSLPAGSRIYTYSETKDIFSGSDIQNIPAYAGGSGLSGLSLAERYMRGKSQSTSSGSAQTSNSGASNSASSSGSSGTRASSTSSSGSGTSSSGNSEKDSYLKTLQNQLDILRAQYEFLEASGAETDTLNEKSKEIQGQLHLINARLRETGGEEKEIVSNSTEWWNELKKIRDLQKEIYENERELLETQATLMENQGKSASDRITKLRQIQDNLHREANYLRSIKASQADINQLSIEWWEIQSRILEIQQNLVDELDAAINRKLLDARKSRDAELAILDRQIKRLQEERDIQEEQLSIEERRKAVEEARFALENAQMERTVRYYNATTGQWEWAADQNAVSAAKKALEDARKDRDKAERDDAHNLAIKELEAQRDEVNARYDALEARWERVTDALSDPLRDIKDILSDLLSTGKLTDSQVALIRSLVGDIEAYTKDIVSFLSFRQYMDENPSGNVNQYLSDFTNGKSDTSSFYDSFIDYINKNPDASWTYTAPDGMQYHSDGTITFSDDPGQEGIRFNSSTDAVKASAEAVKNSVTQSDGYTSPSKNTSTTGAAAAAKAAAEAAKAKASDSSSSVQKTLSGSKSSSSAKKTTSTAKKKTYDSGGILSGLGGIKATLEDEIIVPPDVAAYMLKPTAPQVFKDRMSELGFLYGATTSTPDTVTSGFGARTTNDHYGDVYQYGNITLTEEQARGMTVYELAQMSRGLAAYKYS